MAEPIGAARVELSANRAQFKSDLDGAKSDVRSFANSAKNAMTDFRSSISRGTKELISFKTAGAAVAGAAGLLAVTKVAVDFASKINDVAKAAEVSTKFLQEMRYAAKQSGVDFESFDSALLGFTKRLGDMKNGTGALYTNLKALSPALAESVKGAPSVEAAFQMIVNAADRMGDASQRNALLAAAFGREAGVKLAGLVKEGAKGIDILRERAQKLGLVLSDELIARADQAGDELDTLTDMFKVAGVSLGLELVPFMREFVKLMTDPRAVDSARAIGKALTEGLRFVVDNGQLIITVMSAMVGAKLGGMAGPWGALAGSVSAATAAYIAFDKATEGTGIELEKLEKRLAELIVLQDQWDRNGETGSGFRRDLFDTQEKVIALRAKLAETKTTTEELAATNNTVAGPAFNAAAENANKLTAELVKQNEQLRSLIAAQRDEPSAINFITDAQDALNEAKKQNIDLTTTEGAAWRQAYIEGKQLERLQKDAAKVLEDVKTPLDNYNHKLSELRRLLDEDAISQDTFNKGVKAAQKELDDNNEELKKSKDLARDLGLTFTSAFEEAIAGGGDLRDVLQGLEADLIKLAARKLATEPLFNWFGSVLSNMMGAGGTPIDGGSGGAGGGIFSWLGSLVGFAHGGSFEVGGDAGIDKNLVAFKATRGETVTVSTPGENGALDGGAVMVDASTTVNIYGGEGKAQTRESQNGSGGKTIDVFLDESVAKAINTPGSRTGRALKQIYGSEQQLKGRG